MSLTARTPTIALIVLAATCVLVATATADEKERCMAASESGQDLASAGKLRAAQASFLVCARKLCPVPVAQDCLEQLGALERRLPTVVLSALDGAGAALTHVTVLLDGAVMTTQLDGKAIAVDPGPHLFRFEAGGRSVEVKKMIVEGGKLEPILVTFPLLPGSAPAAPTRTIPTSSVVLAGVGTLALAGFGYFGVSALMERNALRRRDSSEYTSADVDHVRRKAVYADICLGISVLSLAAGAIIFWSTPADARPRPTSAALAVHVTAQGAFASWSLGF